jgi:uncharacterized membrane protein
LGVLNCQAVKQTKSIRRVFEGYHAIMITMAFNVPLNEQLAAAGPPDQIADTRLVRTAFEGPWNRWNLLRTALTTAALVSLSVALLRHRLLGTPSLPV